MNLMKALLKSIGRPIVFTAIGGLVALGAAHSLGWTGKTVIIEDTHQSASKVNLTVDRPLPSAPTDFVAAAERTVEAVVHVKTTAERVQNYYNPFNDLFFGRPSTPEKFEVEGSGSGVILTEDGYIVTNNHVIKGAKTIVVTTSNNDEYEAELIGADPTTDIALLKIEGIELTKVSVANSDEVRLGQWVLAVGNPFNLTSTVTAGIISAKGRDINIIDEQSAIESFLQTDAAVNPGNSGGALVNTLGELVGINTAISSRSGSFEGYSFAVPANLMLKVVNDLMEYGRVQRAFIGINYNEVTAALSEELNLEVNKGVYVANIISGGAADDAGITKGDVIINVNGKSIATGADLTEALGQRRPGEKLSVVVNRSGKNEVFNVVLKNKLGTTEMLSKEEELLRNFGAELEELSSTDKRRLGLRYGIRVSKILGGRFQKAGIPKDFIIVKLNNVYVENVESFERLVRQFNPGDGVLIQGFEPNGKANYYAFEW
ncbi:MAG: Periplasmic pH-dependent serine endoprotease DegQ [Flavobacteriales bacterium UBA4585]|nr:MAG: Periplasmic pH-dependent serine endoprotease DegQ [Flavobacteriales bacterium UBA4585]